MVNLKLRDIALNRLSASQIAGLAGLHSPLAGDDANLGLLVGQRVEPLNECFGLPNGEHEYIVFNWLHSISGWWFDAAITLQA